MIRDDARVWVLLKDVTAVRRIVPPRCAELGYGEEEGSLNVPRNERRVMGYVVGSYVPKGF